MAEIIHLFTINSTKEKVYEAITTQEGLSNWWTEDTIAKPEVDSVAEFRFGDRYLNKMRVTNLVENQLVEWECIEGDKEWIGTTFLFDLEEKDSTTILRFSHNNWKEETDFFASCNFNWGYYLNSLKQYCETGEGTPFNNG